MGSCTFVEESSVSVQYKLNHFIEAQDFLYPQVLLELKEGKKKTHWMWFVFPQILGLGTSNMSVRYGLRSVEHARAYFEHPLLGARLLECAGLLELHLNKTAYEIFGTPDDLKLHSSITLFSLVTESGSIFHRLLRQFFDANLDRNTEKALGFNEA